jgi:perosamine synthetase
LAVIKAAEEARMTVSQFEPCVGEEEIQELTDCIKTKWLTEGKKTEEFVERLKAYTGAKHLVLAPNGTLALYMAVAVAGLGPGDEVIVPDFTFLGSATAVVLAGATPVFADIDPETFNLDPASVRRALSPRTKGIMPVHIYGQAADMDPIMEIAREHKLKVIEDAAQGIGVSYKNRHVGTIGDLGCFSFFADKTMTTGEGGAVLTDDDAMGERLLYFRNQGRLHRGSFIHPQMGWNFRMTDLQCAVGLAQMRKLGWIIERKSEVEAQYRKYLAGVTKATFPKIDKAGVRVPFRINLLVQDPQAICDYLETVGVGVRRFFYPLHKQPCFTAQNSRTSEGIQNSIHAFEHGISLPSSVNLKEAEIEYVCQKIRKFFDE